MMNDLTKFSARGDLIDEIRYKDGRVEIRKDHNIVVNSILHLFTALMKGEENYSGLTHWAVGQGLASWDSSLPNPSPSETKLTKEIGRVALLPNEIKYVSSGNNYSDTPTNILEISHTFGENDCNGTWREFGIFGGNSSDTKDSGVMIDKINHKILVKTDVMEVKRTLRITLNIIR